MTQPVSRKWWLALSIAAALRALPPLPPKMWWWRSGLTSRPLTPYDANDTLSQAVAKSFYQGLSALIKR